MLDILRFFKIYSRLVKFSFFFDKKVGAWLPNINAISIKSQNIVYSGVYFGLIPVCFYFPYQEKSIKKIAYSQIYEFFRACYLFTFNNHFSHFLKIGRYFLWLRLLLEKIVFSSRLSVWTPKTIKKIKYKNIVEAEYCDNPTTTGSASKKYEQVDQKANKVKHQFKNFIVSNSCLF